MKHVSAILALGLAAFMAFGEVIYENDFSTRTSAGAIPYGGWREVPYSVGVLANQVNPFKTSSNDYNYQDNWLRYSTDVSAVGVNVVDLDGNPEAMLSCTPIGNGEMGVRHRLGNTFTSGIVRVQCDMKAPTAGNWPGTSSRSCRLLLGDENFFSPQTPGGDMLKYLAGGAGISMATSNGAYRFFLYGYITATLNSGGYVTDPLPQSGHWYRTVVTANPGTMRYDAAIYDMGTAHPALDAATPATPVWSQSNVEFRCISQGMSAAFTGISSIGLYCYGVSGDTSAPDKTARFDNLRVWHNDVECYVNDFSSRRSRNLAPASTTAVYEAPAVTTELSNSLLYLHGTQIVPALDVSLEKQPIGFDGWRNIHGGGTTIPEINIYTNDNNLVLKFPNPAHQTSTFGITAHPIGRTLVGGKVRFSVDARILFTGPNNVDKFMEAMLGNEKLYDSTSRENGSAVNNYNDGVFARGRLDFQAKGKDEYNVDKRTAKFGTSTDGNGTGRGMVEASEGVATGGKWYRMEFVADLDNGTYDYKVYNVTNSEATTSFGQDALGVLYATNGIRRYENVNAISHFALDSFYSETYFDNVGIWHTPTGSTSEELVYRDDFSGRTIYGMEMAETRLVKSLQRDPVGIDSWTRLYKTVEGIMLVGGDNPALGFASYTFQLSRFVTHDLGGLYMSGKVTAQFDMRAQTRWSETGGCYFWLGSDRFHEGNMYGGSSNADYFGRWAACGAGLGSYDQAHPSAVNFAAYQGDGTGGGSWQGAGTVTRGNWYRFVVKANLTPGTSDVEVYDMGTEHPTLATATPATPVQTFANVPFLRNISDLGGVSCFGFQALNQAASVFVPDERRTLIDNIRFSYAPNGLTIMFR